MWNERLWRYLLVSKNVAPLVEIFFSALVAMHRKLLLVHRANGYCVGHAKRNSMSVENILSQMGPILANYHPAIVVVFPHKHTPTPPSAGR
jgi:hypothetical protein